MADCCTWCQGYRGHAYITESLFQTPTPPPPHTDHARNAKKLKNVSKVLFFNVVAILKPSEIPKTHIKYRRKQNKFASLFIEDVHYWTLHVNCDWYTLTACNVYHERGWQAANSTQLFSRPGYWFLLSNHSLFTYH